MSTLKKLYVWQDEKGDVFRDTAVLTTDNNSYESSSVRAREIATAKLFDCLYGTRFSDVSLYFLEAFAGMVKENGWKLIEIPVEEKS